MKEYYQVNVVKISEEDDYEKGIIGRGTMFGLVETHNSPTLEGLVQWLKDIYEETPYVFEGENNRLEIQRMENASGEKATKSEIERFKTGHVRLWAATYSCYVAKITEDENVKDEISKLELENL